jgi:lambda family phage tail tape measure protein
MQLSQQQWQILVTAADRTADAFNSMQGRMKQTQSVADTTSQRMSAAFSGVTRMLGPLAAGFSAAAVAHKMFTAGIKAGDLGEQAEQIGLTTDALQAYRLVAAQNGVSVEQLDGAMMKLTSSMAEAKNGNDGAIEGFKKLGVKILDANGNLRKTADVMPELARGFLAMESATERDALMKEKLGRSGMRLVTMLEALAVGNERVIDSAKKQGAVISEDVIAAWDKLDNQLKVTGAQADVTMATLGAPIATLALEKVAGYLSFINDKLGQIDRYTNTGSTGARVNRITLESQIAALEKERADIQKLMDHPGRADADDIRLTQRWAGVTERLNTARAALQESERIINNSALNSMLRLPEVPPVVSMPEITVTGNAGGAGHPTADKDKPKGGGGTKSTKTEIDEIGRLLERLDQQAAAAAMTIKDKFGDGTALAAREMEALDDLLNRNFITLTEYDRASADVAARTDDQARAFRGATGGIEGYTAGIEQAFADMSRTNAAFEAGRETVDLLSDALTELATTGEINFQRLLNSFISMLIEMEMRAAASAVFKAVGGGGGIGGLISGLIGGFSGSLSGGAVGGGTGGGYGTYALGGVFNRGNVVPFASGGIVNKPTLFPFANGTGLMGEAGPEAIMPLSRGADGKLGVRMDGGGGEGVTVIVQQTVHVGEFVTTTQYAAGLRSVEQSAREGAMAGIEAKRKRGGTIKQVFR